MLQRSSSFSNKTSSNNSGLQNQNLTTSHFTVPLQEPVDEVVFVKVLVNGKQDDAKRVKVVGVADEQNSDEPNVLEGRGVIGVGEDNRWSLKEEVTTLIEDTLRLSFSDLKEEQPKLFGCKKEYGDYQCENVLSIWPQLKNNPESDFKKPIDVGEEIRKQLEKRDDMIKEVFIHDIGFVTFKLSGKWMAESIHKMLRDGIDTWAPKLYVGKVMVNFPSWDIAGETRVASFRRSYITNTLIRMLKYSKVDVTLNKGFSEEGHKKKAQDKVNKRFSIEEKDGNVTISVRATRAGDKLKPLICGKKDGGFGNASKDLSNLWCGLKKEKANWIVYITPVQQQEYIEMCITAARHARWLPEDRYKSPDTSYAGYKSCSTEVEKLINTLQQVLFFFDLPTSADLPASLLDSALKYTLLKNHRLADVTLDFIELVKEEGNTLRYLLKTRDEIRSFTTKSCEDIDELKKASELTLGEGEVWEEGLERVLGLHLLMFTEVLEESCLSVLPHILCEYLYDLSVKFGRFHTSYNPSVYEVGSVAESTRLLLYEATAMVMDKCFHLLGITLEYSSSEVSIAQSLVSSTEQPMDVNELEDVSDCEADVESDKKKQNRAVGGATDHTSITAWANPIARDPPKILNPRFEPISISVNITTDSEFKNGKMFGHVSVSDAYGLLSDSWGPSYEPDCGQILLFNRDWCNSIDVINYELLYLGNPRSRHSVPFSSIMEISMELIVTNEMKDNLFLLCDHQSDMKFSEFWKEDINSTCGAISAVGEDGHVVMHYILLKDAVDAAIKITCESFAADLNVYGRIVAYYGNEFDYQCDNDFQKGFYMALLYEHGFGSGAIAGDIPLRKSLLAVPNEGGSLIIEAKLMDVESGDVILDDRCEFSSQTRGSVEGQLVGTHCSFLLRVDWSQGPGCSKGGCSYLF
ncbi:arginine--tRNA ligase, chloroplastic/mitochondrial [Artemisia annua]|uniref:arginine--tRNA ligase n=1 Tax=Artemisia annua TaxID=35608 RepID=A0A2U1P1C2_ARTAN|nr:arginine--tRNA ligase, chloroplastic/mitochondrial [Artemisia annua]